jgi:SPP1 family predicted phage head-tail adaptor
MNAGRFDELITVEKYTTTTDTNTGERLESWSTHSQPWALVEEADNGSEPVNADRREHKTRVHFTVRWDSELNTSMRISWGGNLYNILNVAEKQRRMYAKLQTELTQ